MMLQLTSRAARHLVEVRQERGFESKACARFVRRGGRVGLTFALAPGTGDRIVEGENLKVYVAGDIADALDEAIIDARDDDGRTGLVMRRRAGSPVPAGRGG